MLTATARGYMAKIWFFFAPMWSTNSAFDWEWKRTHITHTHYHIEYTYSIKCGCHTGNCTVSTVPNSRKFVDFSMNITIFNKTNHFQYFGCTVYTVLWMIKYTKTIAHGKMKHWANIKTITLCQDKDLIWLPYVRMCDIHISNPKSIFKYAHSI